METIFSTEDKTEAEKLTAMLTTDGIVSQVQQSGTWYEVQVASADAVQGLRTLSHFFKS